MLEVPRIGSAIVLRDRSEAAYSSRIESFDRELLTVVKPVGVPAAFPYLPGTRFDVLWTAPSGQHVLPTELHGSRSEGSVLLWELRPVAASRIEQRREFVRVPAFGRVVLWIGPDGADDGSAGDGEDGGGDDGGPFNGGLDDDVDGDFGGDFDGDFGGSAAARREGYLVDVSEAAMQASIWAEPGDSLLSESKLGVVEFSAHGKRFVRDGVIQGVRRSAEGHEVTVIFRFDQSQRQATVLRREVFAAQVDLRQMWRRQADTPATGPAPTVS